MAALTASGASIKTQCPVEGMPSSSCRLGTIAFIASCQTAGSLPSQSGGVSQPRQAFDAVQPSSKPSVRSNRSQDKVHGVLSTATNTTGGQALTDE